MTNPAFVTVGKTGAPVLVLANSLGATSAMWDAQMPAWLENFQVLRYDYPGHGATPVSAAAASVEGLAQELLALLDQAGIQRFSMVGVSLGGMIGLHLAATAATRVECLVAANFRYYQTEASREQWDQRLTLVQAQGIDAIVDGTANRWLSESFRQRHPERDAAIRTMLRSTSAEGYLAGAQAVRDYDARALVDAIACPVLLISGAQDVAAPEEHLDQLAGSLKNAERLSLPAAHISNIECANMFTQKVAAFLRDHRSDVGKETA
jgi:3-oxoadipate enol-lactonase